MSRTQQSRSLDSSEAVVVGTCTSGCDGFQWSFATGLEGLTDHDLLELVLVAVSTSSRQLLVNSTSDRFSVSPILVGVGPV